MDEFRAAARRRKTRGPFVAAVVVGLCVLAIAIGLATRSDRPEKSAPTTRSSSPAEVATSPTGAVGRIEPRPTSVAVALRARRFAALEEVLDQLARGEADDPARWEVPAYLAFIGFDSPDPELEPILLEWRSAHPDSAFATLALAIHYNERAWHARGSRYARDTPRSAFEEYRRWNAVALPLAREAVERRRDLARGWSLLVRLTVGDPEQCASVAREGLAELPASWRIRRAVANCFKPRWGGNYAAMNALAAEAGRFASRNPRLAWLRGESAADRADLASRDADPALAERWARQALEAGEDPGYLALLARTLQRQERWTEALSTIDRALVTWPELPDLVERRIGMLDALGRGEEARADLLVLTAIDPLHRNAAYWRRRLGKSDREACESLSRQELNAEAISACSALLALSPDDAQVNYWLGRAYLQGGEFEAAKAALHAAIRADPRHRPSIENLDWLYGRSRDWPPVLELWNDYLALEPEDAKALLERAGTHVQMGDRSAGCRDLERSCELGNGEACAIARRRC